jgi:thiol-disulfide isomerase/thioredoxin
MSRVVRRRWQSGAAAALAAACTALAPPPLHAAPPVMAFQLPMLDGSRFVQLADFGSRPVVLNFWGSECPPCVKEMPLLFSMSQDYRSVQFLGVAVDDRASAVRFLARLAPAYPQLIASTQPEVLMRRFGNKLGALPFTVVLDAQHRVCVSRLGEVDAPWLSGALAGCAVEGGTKPTGATATERSNPPR